jgi:hypothetical protein
LFYFKHKSVLREGIRLTAEDTNIESAGALDPNLITAVESAGALDPNLITVVESAGALIPLIPILDTIIDIVIK